jgi:hypothetical protein
VNVLVDTSRQDWKKKNAHQIVLGVALTMPISAKPMSYATATTGLVRRFHAHLKPNDTQLRSNFFAHITGILEYPKFSEAREKPRACANSDLDSLTQLGKE